MNEYLSLEQVNAYLEELIKQYSYPLRLSALRLVKNTHDADDLVQDTFVRAYNDLSRNRTPFTNALAWLYKVMRDLYYDHLRCHKKRSTDSLEALQISHAQEHCTFQQEILMDTNSQPEIIVEQKTTLEQVAAHIRSLPSGGVRDALILCYEGIVSPREISERTGQSYNTARSNVSRGKKMLRTHVLAWINGEQIP